MQIDLQKIQDVAFEAIEQASKITLSYFRNAHLSIEDKRKNNDFDPVTNADKEAEEAIRKVIQSVFPKHNILGEEYGLTDNQSDYNWIIDPIDGTRAFITGIPVWGILIGVTYKENPIFGIMAQPYTGEIFHGDGKQAYLRRGENETLLKADHHIQDLSQSYSLVTSPDIFHDFADKSKFEKLKSNVLHTRFGTDCYGPMMVAMGQAQIVFETGLSPYDIVPLLPIITGSGAVYSNLEGTKDISKGDVLICANKALHTKALELLRDH